MSTTQLMLEWSGELWTTWSHLNSVREINCKKESCCPGSEQVYSTLMCFPESIVVTFPYSKIAKLTSILYMWRKKNPDINIRSSLSIFRTASHQTDEFQMLALKKMIIL